MDNLLQSTFPLFLSALFIGLILAWVKKLARNYVAEDVARRTGVMKPHRGIAWFTTITGFIFLVLGAFSVYVFGTEMVIWGSACAVMGAVIFGFSIPSLTAMHDVSWSDLSITGPSKTFGWTLGRTQATIAWDDITKIGQSKHRYRYIESKIGERIYWAFGSENFGEYEATLKKHHPDLEWPELFK